MIKKIFCFIVQTKKLKDYEDGIDGLDGIDYLICLNIQSVYLFFRIKECMQQHLRQRNVE